MRFAATFLAGFYVGGVAIQAAHYLVWLAVNPTLGPHWQTVASILSWPWDCAINLIAYCV